MRKNFIAQESNYDTSILNTDVETNFDSTTMPTFDEMLSSSFEEGMRYSPVNNIVKKTVDWWTADPNEEKIPAETLNSMYPDLPEKFTSAMTTTRAADIVRENNIAQRNQEIISKYTEGSLLASAASMGASSLPAMFDPINLAGGRLVSLGAKAGVGIFALSNPGFAAKVASMSASRMGARIVVEGTENTVANIAMDAAINNPVLKSDLMERQTDDFVINGAIAGFGFPVLKEVGFRPLAKLVNRLREFDPKIDQKLDNIVEQQVVNDKQINVEDAIQYHAEKNGVTLDDPEFKKAESELDVKQAFEKANSDRTDLYYDSNMEKIMADKEALHANADPELQNMRLNVDERIKAFEETVELLPAEMKLEIEKATKQISLVERASRMLTGCVVGNKR